MDTGNSVAKDGGVGRSMMDGVNGGKGGYV